ncbi:hypothetical protein KFL_004890120 [Klebsormidium nitens]|uniref:Uncharacterized protein n=1 Tax=Klebsormidium nitens TaxID=105231 RepID=A0A1Y1IHZ7_KLENI|nr:hypothetical protein KFL_004890120 [Klebsormidium nitens]|eukprot:GAQ89129.1 hypothetical protein KFL_004890120 [Klebsormidium nitens]
MDDPLSASGLRRREVAVPNPTSDADGGSPSASPRRSGRFSEVVEQLERAGSSVKETLERAQDQASETWKAAKKRYHLMDFHEMPAYLQDNEFIRHYYRGEMPLKHAALSLFKVHNETLNIWTHFLGFLLFVALTIYTWRTLPLPRPSLPHIPSFVDLLHLRQHFPTISHALEMADLPHLRSLLTTMGDGVSATLEDFAVAAQALLAGKGVGVPQLVVTRWPFFVFLAGAMTCLLSSATCHLLACHSHRTSAIIWRFDYCGIAVMVATSFFPPVYYSFLCDPLWRYMYLIGISVIGLCCIAVSLIPTFQTAKWRTFRASMFAGMGMAGIIPCLHKLAVLPHESVVWKTTRLEAAMGALYLIGALFYSTRIPERWKPGTFDIAGSSHQIFHLFVLAAAYLHYNTGLIYLDWRDKTGCPP